MDFHHLIVKILKYSYTIIEIVFSLFITQKGRENYGNAIALLKKNYSVLHKFLKIIFILLFVIFLISLLSFIFPYLFLNKNVDIYLLTSRIIKGLILFVICNISVLIIFKQRNEQTLDALIKAYHSNQIMFYFIFSLFVFSALLLLPQLVYLTIYLIIN